MIHGQGRRRRDSVRAVLDRVFGMPSGRTRRPPVMWSGGVCPPPVPTSQSRTDRSRTPILAAWVSALGVVAAALVVGVFSLWSTDAPAWSPGAETCEWTVNPTAPPAAAVP